jgi:uncharacterized protein YbjT (DUF2867 family)
MTPRATGPVLFLAGATGATGRTALRLASERGIEVVAHVRPRSVQKLEGDPRAIAFELTDGPALEAALKGCTAVLQLIGTIRQRFSQGDTYASSDIETTRLLVEAAKRVGAKPHVVLLSSVGAGRPVGAYLKAKAEAERVVIDSGLSYTLVRPSALVGDRHHVPGWVSTVTRGLGLRSFQPITLEALAAALLYAGITQSPRNAIVEGKSLWSLVDAASP